MYVYENFEEGAKAVFYHLSFENIMPYMMHFFKRLYFSKVVYKAKMNGIIVKEEINSNAEALDGMKVELGFWTNTNQPKYDIDYEYIIATKL